MKASSVRLYFECFNFYNQNSCWKTHQLQDKDYPGFKERLYFDSALYAFVTSLLSE